ncbi:cobalamin biosynthesis protein [Pseudomonas putida]|uniref:cobalamin biosynthesis protein n=1 Tax=Pseudomonas putida TaxID=303 RepID=UPI0008196FD9|nr:cobalamin biosynthesis protein [Pseudomonas putida]OCT22082.1 cobalamin biosynthesis protein CobE [Pseudomonas putida]OCT25448.1 cobalamin biosynthesis protein CobE [Pseudomonas putida]OCT26828.1 cobalamin biosynthesis protein CobE [Pseudomonas putida]OCT40511.1 cobalamin biosynthesis protein CobE [Pseudomonas putida]
MAALYVGFGCRRGCPAAVLETLLHLALASNGLTLAELRGIASIDLKAQEPGLRQLAEQLGLPLTLYSAQQLQPFLPLLSHRSEMAFNTTGCWGVAESAALALAASEGQHSPILTITRQVLGDATLALASNG